MGTPVKGRANTDSEKEVIIKRLLVAWKCMPELRLGQLLMNSFHRMAVDPFYIEDSELIKQVENFIANFERTE